MVPNVAYAFVFSSWNCYWILGRLGLFNSFSPGSWDPFTSTVCSPKLGTLVHFNFVRFGVAILAMEYGA